MNISAASHETPMPKKVVVLENEEQMISKM